jgi:hypothetical protein
MADVIGRRYVWNLADCRLCPPSQPASRAQFHDTLQDKIEIQARYAIAGFSPRSPSAERFALCDENAG